MKIRWNTKQIQSDLSQLFAVVRVDINPPGGDVDTDNLIIRINGTNEYLIVCGFNTSDDMITAQTPSDVDVEMIQLCDTSGDGLQSNNPTLAVTYVEVRQYFVNQDIEVVPSMDPYF